jgi:hypothetical protein
MPCFDLVVSRVTNQSMRDACLESRFGLHVDINYCAHGELILCFNIRSYSSYNCRILMFKLDDAMPVI